MRRRPAGALLVLAASAVFAAPPDERRAIAYSSRSVFVLGSGVAGQLAPNTLAVVYGENLSNGVATRADVAPDPSVLPTVLPGTGVTVRVNGILAAIEYASPEAVVFVVPPELLPGAATVVLTRNGLLGPSVRVQLKESAPALLPLEEGWALARHAEAGEWCTQERPLLPGEEVILYGTGWGPTVRRPINLQPATRPNELRARESLRVLLDGIEVPESHVLYAGLSVGAAGAYEARVRLPVWTPPDPEIRLAVGQEVTPTGLRLRVGRLQAQPADERLRSTQ